MAQPPVLIIVTGMPATGKTTLARALAAELRLPLLTKDMLKELLFDRLGVGDLAWSARLGRLSIELLMQFVAVELTAGRSCMIEANFDPQLARADLLALGLPFRPVQILCRCADALVVRRFLARGAAGQRHPGHQDALVLPRIEALLRRGGLGPLDLPGPVLVVDTDDFAALSIPALAAQVHQALSRPPAPAADDVLE